MIKMLCVAQAQVCDSAGPNPPSAHKSAYRDSGTESFGPPAD